MAARRLIKLSFNDCPASGTKREISLRQLTLIYLAHAGMVKQFDVNFVGMEFGWKSWTAHFHVRVVLLLVKGPAGIFCKRDYIAHVQTGSNNSLWERVRGKSSFHRRCLPYPGPVTGLFSLCIRCALRNSRQRLFFSPTCWRIGSTTVRIESPPLLFFFPHIVRIFLFFFFFRKSHSDSMFREV